MSDIILQKIKKGFGQDEPPVLKEIDLQIHSGEFLVLLGPSGCGKTTLLRCIAGLEQTDAGNILIDDRNVNNVPSAKRGLAMVFSKLCLVSAYDSPRQHRLRIKTCGLAERSNR